jgi:phage replication O-like protein O
MIGPQLEDGYTRIANEILEQISQIPISGTQFRILMVIWRYTYGYNRKECEISSKFIAEASGLSERQVRRELKKLIDMNIIKVVKEATFTSPRILAFNKYYDTWQVTKQTSEDELDHSTNQTGEDKLDRSSPDKLDLSPPDKSDPHIKKNNKDNNKDNKYNTCLLRKQDANGVPPLETPPTNKEIIAELTEKYRSIEGIQPEKSDYAFIGNCYNRFGYAHVLEAIHILSARMSAGFKPDKPKVYMLGILKSEVEQERNKGAPAKTGTGGESVYDNLW